QGTSGENLRAIPWQFAWTQTRLLLGAWLGVEEALERAGARGAMDLLREMHRRCPLFRAVITLMELVLPRGESRTAADYARRLVPPRLQPIGADLRARLGRAV